MTKIVIISDTHDNDLRDLDLPEGDILVHCGDATGMGTVQAISKFNYQLSCLPHKHKIFIPGNHDWLFEKDRALAKTIMTNAIVLINEGITIEGIKFWGSPVTPEFNNWAFNYVRGDEIKKFWDIIPTDTEFLVTHGPPMYVLDQLPDGKHIGCFDLYNKIQGMNLKCHSFGHIHYAYGEYKSITTNTQFINAAICNEGYWPINKPWVIEVDENKNFNLVK